MFLRGGRVRGVITAAVALALGGLATPATSAAAVAASGGSSVGSPVPAGFRAQSTTWPSARQGWVLGTAPCAEGQCTSVVTSGDGGRSWSAVGAPSAPLAPPGEPGVTEIRFADSRHGWAFGPSFYTTSDGGQSWRESAMPGGGQQVTALETAVGVVYAAVSPCPVGEPCSEPSSVWRAGVENQEWQKVPVTLPGAFAVNVVLAAHQRLAYIAMPGTSGAPDVFFASLDGGRNWSSRPSPCVKEQGEALVDIAPMPAGSVALLCVGNAGFSRATKHVFRSIDTAQTTTDAGITPLLGIQSTLAATPSGTLVVSSVSSGSWLYRNTGGQTWETVREEEDGGAGWNNLLFTTDTTGFVVYAPAAVADGAGALLTTSDAGATWTPVEIASPATS